MNTRLARTLILAVTALYLIPVLSPMFSSQQRDFHDFRVYYEASANWAAGGDPYAPVSMTLGDGTAMTLPYVYPPVVLPFFRLFSLLDYDTACLVLLLTKLAMLAVLLAIWTRVLLRDGHPLFFLFCLLAYNSPIYIDLTVGNVAVFEQFLLWMGLTFYLQRKVPAFCVSVVAASFFKLSPILFLLLLLAPGYRTRNNLRWGAGSAGAFGLIMLISWLSSPGLWDAFAANAKTLNFLGIVNPSSYAFWDLLRMSLDEVYGIDMPAGLVSTLYLATVAGVVTGTVLAFRKMADAPDRRLQIALFCLAYALVLPRFPDYAYMLILAPSWYVLTRTRSSALVPGLLLCCLPAVAATPLPGAPLASHMLYNQLPLLVAFVIWGLGLRLVYDRQQTEPAPGEADPV